MKGSDACNPYLFVSLSSFGVVGNYGQYLFADNTVYFCFVVEK